MCTDKYQLLDIYIALFFAFGPMYTLVCNRTHFFTENKWFVSRGYCPRGFQFTITGSRDYTTVMDVFFGEEAIHTHQGSMKPSLFFVFR